MDNRDRLQQIRLLMDDITIDIEQKYHAEQNAIRKKDYALVGSNMDKAYALLGVVSTHLGLLEKPPTEAT